MPLERTYSAVEIDGDILGLLELRSLLSNPDSDEVEDVKSQLIEAALSIREKYHLLFPGNGEEVDFPVLVSPEDDLRALVEEILEDLKVGDDEE